MNARRAVIAGMGIISPIGQGIATTLGAIERDLSGVRPCGLFDYGEGQPCLPVGMVDWREGEHPLPRTHRFALAAAQGAMTGSKSPPDAIVLGVTTGGMLTTENRLKAGASDPAAYRRHSPASVTALIARRLGCRGPALTVSTACSSGAVAIALAVAMIRVGWADSVLAGGVDSLCRLTYHGFNALKIVDPKGARPFDRDRAGMSVAEGAAFLLLGSGERHLRRGIAEIRGTGLSCDAYHPAAPHPEGRGAFEAMAAALEDAGLDPGAVGAVNLHGTGTRENDSSEAQAIRRLFEGRIPPLSSIKGATGHALAASGAIEAVVAALSVSEGMIPGTVGCRRPDPRLGLRPEPTFRRAPVSTVLSNSLGFGGNNAALVVGLSREADSLPATVRPAKLTVVASACITGAGGTELTLACLERGDFCGGICPTEELNRETDARLIRRLRRLPRMALRLATAACRRAGCGPPVRSVFLGSGWGALSETHEFLSQLFDSGERFCSPTDFIGSVHNAPAAQIALAMGATGANITMTGGDTSFEQALFAATLLGEPSKGRLLVVGADEYHPVFSPLCDRSAAGGRPSADGGGALCLSSDARAHGPSVEAVFFRSAEGGGAPVHELVETLGGAKTVRTSFGAVLAGIPGAVRPVGSAQLRQFLDLTRFGGPVIDYRSWTGEFAAASAVATAAAACWSTVGRLPATLCSGRPAGIEGKGILLLGFGEFITAVTLSNKLQGDQRYSVPQSRQSGN